MGKDNGGRSLRLQLRGRPAGPKAIALRFEAQPDRARLREASLHAAVSAQAARTPGACAVLFESASYSYAWLEERSGQIASHLRSLGVARDDVVAVYMERSPEMIAVLLGCLKAQAAYLPLDPGFPADRLQTVLADAQPTVLVTERALDGTLPSEGRSILVVESCLITVDDASFEGPQTAGASAGDLAYVIYTSGSTGRPKGVEITHGAVMNLLASFAEIPGFSAGDRMLAATTTAFDISVIEIFLPLVLGGRMVLASRAVARDPQRLAELIEQEGCTVAQATPSMWRYLLDSGWSGKADLTIISGGEALTRDLANRLLSAGRVVWNVYGPTETTVWSAIARVEPGDGPVPIGRAISQTSLHILDDAGRPAADDEVGELHIGGMGLARGYRGQPDLTLERFALHDGVRHYRTGDLVRRRPDGALECLGRTDQQVKIRGFRIELGDVEAALTASPSVSAAAVVARPGPARELELVAYVSGAGGVRLRPAELRDALASKLPAYMVPSRFFQLAALPFTPNGKIDRKALPELDAAASFAIESSGEADDPQSGTETRLAAIWSSILGVYAVSRRDNFFDLGGYSLLTVSLLQRIRETFGRTLSIAALFSAQDLAAMAAMVDAPALPSPVAIPLQPQGELPPLIWLDAGPQLRPLAARLAPDQPLFGVNLDPAEEAEFGDGALSATALAARLVRTIRRFQPKGPYSLGGWCRWGAVAHAAACQLQSEGDEVALLVLLDTVNHASAYQSFARLKSAARGRLRLRARKRPTFGERVEAAAVRYRPPRFRGAALLLRASDAERDWDGVSGWLDAIKGDLRVADLPGDHRSVLAPPFVDALACELRAALCRARAPCG